MKRWLAGAVLAFVGLVLAGSARAQDRVSYNDRTAKKVVDIDGAIEEETPVGLKLKTKTGPRTIPADDIKALTDYKTLNPAGWEIVPALKTLARLQEENGKTDDARKTYEELGDLADVPREVKMESDMLVSRLLLRGGKYADAEKKLKS